ncbi:S1C family serine protease [Streptomyces sp. NPDC050504]|uniref:S1C family serine protease n=1 Tax=Streptomyces sp. NPDC050504 TaxID=3365618 RepID=UPI0037B72167
MSTENEGTNAGTNAGPTPPVAPSVPSAPPAPAAAPAGEPAGAFAAAEPVSEQPARPHPQSSAAPQPPTAPQTHAPAAPPAAPQTQAPAAPPAAPPAPAAPPVAAAPVNPAAPPTPPPADAAWPPPPPAQPAYGAGGTGGDPYGGGGGAYGGGGASGGGGGPVWGASAPAPSDAPRKRAGGLVATVLAAALVAGGIGGGIGYWAADRNDRVESSGSTTVSAGDSPADLKREPGTVAGVAAKALPSVVTIQASAGDGEGGTGTGFVYDQQGHILTNNHVVASAANGGEVSATFSNGKKYAAEVVGRAQGYDVAVLKLKNPPAGLTPLPLGNSDKVAVGDSTIAIGAPFGLSNTVTTGIVSAKDRPVASGDGQSNKNSYMSALQTDASINPGNSGGPLLDARGAVIGINSAIQSPGGGGFGQSQAGSVGLGFAIPINQAKNVAEQLIKTGKPVYPVIGATVDVSRKNLDGATIPTQGQGGGPAVTPNGPAAKAGLKAGDVITRLNDTVIDSGPTLIGEIWTYKPGDKVKVTFERDGKQQTVELTLGQREGDD